MLADLKKDPPKCLQKTVPSLSWMIARPVKPRVSFEIRPLRIGFEMDRLTHEEFFLRVQ